MRAVSFLAVAVLGAGCTLIIQSGIDGVQVGDGGLPPDGGTPGGDGGNGSDAGGTSDGGGTSDAGGSDAGQAPPCVLPDGGTVSWTLSTTLSNQLYGVWAASDSEAWVCGVGLLQHFVGNAWTPTTSPTPTNDTFYGVFGTSPGDVWTVGNSLDVSQNPIGLVWHFDGAHWTDVSPNWSAMGISNGTLYDVWAPQPGEAWVVGTLSAGTGIVLHSLNGSWINDADAGISVLTSGLNAVTSDHTGSGGIWAAGSDALGAATLLHRQQGVWSSLSTGVGSNVANFDGLWVWSPTMGAVGGDSASSFCTADAGGWSLEGDATLENAYFHYHSIWGSGPHDVWAVSSFPDGLVDQFNGGGWQPNDLTTTPCTVNTWDAIGGACRTFWMVNLSGQVCQGSR